MLGQLIVTFRFETRTTTELYLKGCLTCSQKIYMPRKSSLFFFHSPENLAVRYVIEVGKALFPSHNDKFSNR